MTRVKVSVVIKIVALVFYFLLAFFLAKAQVVSDFNVNDEGWTVFDNNLGASNPVTNNPTGGNPGGFDSFSTSSGALNMYWTAPAKFLGNLSRSYNQNLTFDLKVSFAGSDNTIGDVIITSPSGTLFYQLPVKPAVASWSSYSVQLSESLWHNGSIGGAAPNQLQMKQVLATITKLQIRFKYFSGNTFPYIGQLDNVVLNQSALGTPPTITSFTPASALTGATVTITGTNFNTTPSQNLIYFNGIKATATSASATQLTVKVPTSAAYGLITVADLTTGLQATSVQNFNPLFDNNKDFGGQIIPASMGRGYNVLLPMNSTASNSSGKMDKGDFDGDGWIDLVTTETSTQKIYAFRNLGTGGSVSVSSFASAITLPGISSIPGGAPSLAEVIVVDVDSDGKLDIAASTASNTSGFLAVYRNTSSVGSISFASPLFFAYNYYNALSMATGDLDGDGRTDFAFTTGSAPGNIFISQNLSTPGNIDFAFGVNISSTSTAGLSDIAIADLTGDGKPEIICPGYNAATISIYQNNSTPGTISMATAFTIPSVVSYTNQIAVVDLDADGKLDMTWSTYGAQYVYFTKNIYSGGVFDATAFGSTIQVTNKLSNPLGINVGDVNSDGKPDVIVSGYNDLAVLQNVGATGNLNSTSFMPTVLFQGSSSSASIFGLSPVVADLDGDNKSEVAFVSSVGAGIYIFHNESFPAPRIDTMTPSSGLVGSSVTFTGDHFSTGIGFPPVYGRLSKIATAILPSSNTLASSVVTPSISGRFTFTEHGLTASSKPFNILFNTNRTINSSSFGPNIDFVLTINPRDALDVADFNDDGKVDVSVIDNGFTAKIFENTQAIPGQPITTASLAVQATTYSSGYNLIALDIDGDGKIDLNSGGGLLQNTSSASISFNSVTSTTGGFNTSSSADFNKDGKIDLVFTNGSTNVQVYENLSSNGSFTPNGTFQNFGGGAINLVAPSAATSVVAADFDGDGYEDIISVNANTNNSTYFLNNKVYGQLSTSSFSFLGNYSTSGSQPYDITANDFDGDGKIDIAITYFNSIFVSVLLNKSALGDISFTATDVPVANKGYKLTSQDLDGDGKAEIVLIHQPNPGPGSFTVLQNKCTIGTASFVATNFSITRNPQAINIADINSDSKPDILIVANSGTLGNALMVFENKIVTPVISITSQPTAVYSVCDGATPVISTVATGTTNISYQWQIFNSGTGTYVDLTNTGGYSNVSTASFTINSTGNFGAGTYRCKINGDFVSTIYSNTVSFSVNPVPPTPVTSNASNCGPGSLVLSASGATSGNYFWYDTNGLIVGQNNSTYTTPVISSTSFYSVRITDGTCVSPPVNITATINTIPVAPTTLGASQCSGSTFLLTASGGSNGQYVWYTTSSGGSAITGEVNSTYTTPALVNTTTYYVSINNGACESARTPVIATVNTTGCSIPVITTTPLTTEVGGVITLNLVQLITTTNNNLNISSIVIIQQPSSGAIASIVNGVLTITYTGVAFSGSEQITIQACDIDGNCATQIFTINVAGDIVVYNGISPDGKNPAFLIDYINLIPETKDNTVYIFDRWENLVWHGTNYDNTSVVFTGVSDSGGDLPSGVYFYKLDFASGKKTKTGFISLRR